MWRLSGHSDLGIEITLTLGFVFGLRLRFEKHRLATPVARLPEPTSTNDPCTNAPLSFQIVRLTL